MQLLKDLNDEEFLKVIDALKPQQFQERDNIINEGDDSADLFFLQAGTASAYKANKEVKKYQTGDYFGELALLRNAKRAATVTATVMELSELL